MAVALLSIIVVPVVVDLRGFEAFRLPKNVAFLAFAILAAAVMIIGWLRRELEFAPLFANRFLLAAVAAIVVWTGITTLTSTNRVLSWDAFQLVLASVVLFFAYLLIAPRMPLAGAAVIFAGAVPNAFVLMLQWFDVWNFVDLTDMNATAYGRRLGLTGLLGNANDAGVYLLVNLIVAVALAFETRGALRKIAIAISLLIAAGMLATMTLTSMVGALAAFSVMAFIRARSKRRLVLAAVAFAAVIAGVALASTSIRHRVRDNINLVRSGQITRALSGRPIAYVAAWRMFVRHPLLGVGPGCFKFHFFDMKVEIARDYPAMILEQSQNFGEAHNDHLQILAENGVFGYVLFVAVNAFIATRCLRRRDDDDDRRRFVRAVALPAVVGLFVSALAQFPVELAATRITYLFLYALCCSWCMEPRWSDAS